MNGLNDHFSLNFHYYGLPLTRIICYLFTVESVYTSVYTRDQRRSAESGVADRDPQNIGIHARKICGSSVDAISSEP